MDWLSDRIVERKGSNDFFAYLRLASGCHGRRTGASGEVVEVPLRKPIRRRQIVFAALSDSEMPKSAEKFFEYIAGNE